MSDDDDEPIDAAIYNVAVVATQLLTVAEQLALQYDTATARSALLVACTIFSERSLGRAGMLAELSRMIAALTVHPSIEDVINTWLH